MILHCVKVLQFIYPLFADRYLSCVQIFAIMNNVSLNILVPVSQDPGEEIWRSITPIVIGNQQCLITWVLLRNANTWTLS